MYLHLQTPRWDNHTSASRCFVNNETSYQCKRKLGPTKKTPYRECLWFCFSCLKSVFILMYQLWKSDKRKACLSALIGTLSAGRAHRVPHPAEDSEEKGRLFVIELPAFQFIILLTSLSTDLSTQHLTGTASRHNCLGFDIGCTQDQHSKSLN